MTVELGREKQLTQEEIASRNLRSRAFRKIDVVVYSRITGTPLENSIDAILNTVIEGGAIDVYRKDKYVSRREAAEEIIGNFVSDNQSSFLQNEGAEVLTS